MCKKSPIVTTAQAKGGEPGKELHVGGRGKAMNRGGMHFNAIGMGLNLLVPPVFLAATAAADWTSHYTGLNHVFALLLLTFIQAALAYTVHGMRRIVCVLLVPCCISSLLLLPGTLKSPLIPTFALAMAFTTWRVGVCMSGCLHRYAAHAAFKCGSVTRFLLNVLGCAAHQGGPIWWAAHHRVHHKYCDMPRDPHSAKLVGTENAFSFFMDSRYWEIEEEFSPKHNDSSSLRLLDTWAFAVCTVEMLAVYYNFGREGLFISHTSIWLNLFLTLWFNIANHPESATGTVCKAANRKNKHKYQGWYPGFMLLDILLPFTAFFSEERNHGDHHTHGFLAKRSSIDLVYYTFILPLETFGLVWDVKKFDDGNKKH